MAAKYAGISFESVLTDTTNPSDDFLVAAPVLNRDGQTEDTIGYYGNTVAMRLRPSAVTPPTTLGAKYLPGELNSA